MTGPHVPPLPRALADPRPVLALGTAVWLIALLVVVVLASTGSDGLGTEIRTCLVGTGLGAIGYAIFTWQRRAARRGGAGAQSGLTRG